MPADLLTDASWTCRATPAGSATHPGQLPGDDWVAAEVPGTAAGALRAAGRWHEADPRDFDAEDWWFRCRFEAPSDDELVLRAEGLATLAEVWCNGTLVGTSGGMFTPLEADVTVRRGANELAIRFLALGPVVRARRPRGRWRSRIVAHQHLRWQRTTFLGRMPGWAPVAAPVGPWRPLSLAPRGQRRVLERDVQVTCDGDAGSVALRVRLAGAPTGAVTARVGEVAAELDVRADGDAVVAEGTVRLPSVERWWPHTHGDQPRYAVSLEVGDVAVPLGQVGFRTIDLDADDGAFTLVVNGQPVFARGACWVPPDVVSLTAGPDEVRATLERARDAGMNMVRVLGTMVWEDAAFWDLCDELGMLVWQDCMFANLDPPDDEAWLAGVDAELRAQLGALQGRPALAVVCGGSEVEQQAAMVGLPAEGRAMPLFEVRVPKVLDELALGVPYVPSSPTGGDLPFRTSTGVAHYYGVGAYLRPLDDARRAGVRFASECLAFANPPERAAVEDVYGTAAVAGHHPDWKRAVPRDNGAPWDFEDVRDHYVATLFEVDPTAVRYADPERYLDLGRAAVTEVVEHVFTEWRRPGSSCAGGLVLLLRDLWAGAGWGLLDASGGPKAPFWAVRRTCRPVALLATDEGLDGWHLHVVNDTAGRVTGTLAVSLLDHDGRVAEEAAIELDVAPRSAATRSAESVLDGFRDLTAAYRFGPPAFDVVTATFRTDGGSPLDAVLLPGGRARPVLPTVGLEAELRADGDAWAATVTATAFAQRVAFDVPGFVPEDSWFHLVPGAPRTVALRPAPGQEGRRPTGSVRALNARATARLQERTS
jgi:beta-mannosidase